MDDLLREFLTETNESLDTVDVELVRFEQEPNNAKILDNIFRLVHTIKGTCGFLNLPRLDGYGVLSHLRSRPATANLPVIVLTAYGTIENAVGALHAGAAHYLTKPADPAALQRLIEDILEFQRVN